LEIPDRSWNCNFAVHRRMLHKRLFKYQPAELTLDKQILKEALEENF
jgi:hypothetical protein